MTTTDTKTEEVEELVWQIEEIIILFLAIRHLKFG